MHLQLEIERASSYTKKASTVGGFLALFFVSFLTR
jgi:hypothetical protein